MNLEELGIYVPYGSGQVRTICPQCSPERNKSKEKCLAVNTYDGTYFCHHCGWAGKALDKKPNPVIHYKQQDKLPEHVAAFFRERGITDRVLERNKISWDGKFILFPYFEGGKIVNIKYRSLNKEFKQEKGGKKIFYGIDDVDGDTVTIVEGELDKLAFEMAGYQNVISVPDGAPPENAKAYHTKFDFIANCETKIKDLKKIILAVDGDRPGKKLEEELIRRLGAERCFRINWPEGCKDANDVLIRHGEFMLMRLIDEAAQIPVVGLFEVKDFKDELDLLFSEGLKSGISPGWIGVERFYTVRPGEWTVVTGIPSHGKSQFVMAMIVNICLLEEWKFAIFSPEMQPLQRCAAQIAQSYAGKPYYSQFMSDDERTRVNQWMQDNFVFVLPPDDELTIDHILNKAKVAVMRYGIKGLIIDPWNELDHSRPSAMTEPEYISLSLTKIRSFARRHQVHVWVVAHPTKLQKDKSGNYPVPTPYDISGAAHWRNKADCCLCIWRDLSEESDRVDVYIQKVRFREVGMVGKAELYFNQHAGRYREI